MDWDRYWRFELLHRAHDPVDFRRWKRASQRILREHFAGPNVRLLDATAGLGDHTVNLAELGFAVEACDASAVAREATTRATRDAGLAVPVFDARWEALGETHPARYDLIFHDALHWVEAPEAMHAALRGLRGALVPGGALVFFYADAREPDEGAGARALAWDREHLREHELGWSHLDAHGARVTHTRVNVPAGETIEQHHLYTVTDRAGKTQLESLVMRRVYRWDWHAMTAALRDAGFGEVRSLACTNDKGHSFAMNLAYRPTE